MAGDVRGAPLKYPWDKAKLKKKAIVIKGKTFAQIAPSAYSWAKRHGRVFKLALVPGGVSVRRVK